MSEVAIHDDCFDYGNFFRLLAGHLDERSRRLVAAAAARSLPRGGVSTVSRLFGISRSSIDDGIRDLGQPELPAKADGSRRLRAPGAGRKTLLSKDPTIRADIEKLVQPHVRGNPVCPLQWISKSLMKIRAELAKAGHRVSDVTVGRILKDMGYTLQSCKKSHEGGNSPYRDEQFRHIAAKTETFLKSGDPVISVDTKKKELVGNYRNAGRDYRPKGIPVEVNVHDFIGEGGRATPYGVYDVGKNEGFVNVGIGPDTAEFAVESIGRWWSDMGKARYPKARRLYVNADGGGSNGSRCRLWKKKLQDLADSTGLAIDVSHFPPGTSKWNKIEHRMFSFITANWRGRPLTSLAVIVNLISNTTNSSNLKVKAVVSKSRYKTGVTVTDDGMKALSIAYDGFHPEWNYTVSPHRARTGRARGSRQD